jgi:type III secretion protein J
MTVNVRRATVLLGVFGLVACGAETVVHRTDERQANRILELLSDNGIRDVTKTMVDTGRETFFTISVPRSVRLQAIKVLNDHELPTPEDQGYDEVFVEGGLIPTNAEERAKFLQALEGEIQRQLKLIDGILDVEVQVVVPEEDALRTTQETVPDTTASVTVKYLPGAGGSKPLSEPEVQAIVAAGVESLTPDKVVVVMTQGGRRGGAVAGPAARPRTGKSFWDQPVKRLNIIAMTVVGLMLLLSLGIIYAQLRLRAVRGRLIRLQTEISRARQKPTGGESSVG